MTIIFLNGAGSSGKSSIAKAIQHLADKPYIAFIPLVNESVAFF